MEIESLTAPDRLLATPRSSMISRSCQARRQSSFDLLNITLCPLLRLLVTGPLAETPCYFAGLDYLASPNSVIQQAQQLAATSFGADQTWFLVNGTSVGIHAAVMATCGPGDCLVLARNCHQSAFAAAVFAGKRSQASAHVHKRPCIAAC